MPPKQSLGKGLGAMFPDLLTDASSRPAFLICGIEALVPNRFQPRRNFRDAEQRQLVQSIHQNGIVQPILVRRADEGYEIIAGERRWRAAQEAGLNEVPVIVREATDRDLAEVSLIENLQREDLDPIEEANAYQTLMETFGLSQEEVSSRVGRERSTVANTVRLLKLPGEARQAIVDRKISAGHGRALLALDTAGEQRRALAQVLKKRLSVRETEALVQRSKRPTPLAAAKRRDPYVADLERTLSKTVKSPVKIHQGRKKGYIQIAFQNTEELNRLSRLLLG
jgi:ParB family chromosome partitioning protein